MLRMEIALFLVVSFVAYIYFTAEKKWSPLHKTFSALLVVVLFHLVFDGITVHTVNHLDTVPRLLNDTFHRLFIGTMILIFSCSTSTLPFWLRRKPASPAGWTKPPGFFWCSRSWEICFFPFITP